MVLVDSNVILDVLTEDKDWFEWSSRILMKFSDVSVLAINPIIYAEVSIRFARIEDLEDALSPQYFVKMELPWEAAFLAGKCFLKYRNSGERRSPLPDFYIGAHAAVMGLPLITRDKRRYRSYFPKLDLISP